MNITTPSPTTTPVDSDIPQSTRHFPVEICLQIFNSLPDLHSLDSLSRTSRTFREIYLKYRDDITDSIVHRAFPPQALEILDASRHPYHNDRYGHRDIVNWIQGDWDIGRYDEDLPETRQEKGFSDLELWHLVQDQRTVEDMWHYMHKLYFAHDAGLEEILVHEYLHPTPWKRPLKDHPFFRSGYGKDQERAVYNAILLFKDIYDFTFPVVTFIDYSRIYNMNHIERYQLISIFNAGRQLYHPPNEFPFDVTSWEDQPKMLWELPNFMSGALHPLQLRILPAKPGDIDSTYSYHRLTRRERYYYDIVETKLKVPSVVKEDVVWVEKTMMLTRPTYDFFFRTQKLPIEWIDYPGTGEFYDAADGAILHYWPFEGFDCECMAQRDKCACPQCDPEQEWARGIRQESDDEDEDECAVEVPSEEEIERDRAYWADFHERQEYDLSLLFGREECGQEEVSDLDRVMR